MEANTVLEWEMHGPCTEVRFSAARAGQGFEVTLRKDGTLALVVVLADGHVLMQRSQALRSELRKMGYTTQRDPFSVPHVGFWSSFMPLEPSLASLLAN